MIFDEQRRCLFSSAYEYPQYYPQAGWVEQDAEELLGSVLHVARTAIGYASENKIDLVALGLTNQRETVLVWDRKTGRPLHRALVWQDRRTAKYCAELKESYGEERLADKTGLLFDPYFSASKIHWLLNKIDGAPAAAKRGEIGIGTVDSFLIFRLTSGRSYATDITNASRTSLFNIERSCWDDELCELFDIPITALPQMLACDANFGETDPDILGVNLPILGVAGDQQAAAIGQGCFEPGSIKSTYGTGCFILVNSGAQKKQSKHRLLTTIAYEIDGQKDFALEGSIFVAGAVIQWLRDALHIIEDAPATESMASALDSNHSVYLVPAFTGLGAPYWRAEARGAIFGLTRDTGRKELARAALESVAYQTHDLIAAMKNDGVTPTSLRVDGGMVSNDWFMQFLADILDLPVQRPFVMETTALGAAILAGMGAGLYPPFKEMRKENLAIEQYFQPKMLSNQRDKLLSGWEDAITKLLGKP